MDQCLYMVEQYIGGCNHPTLYIYHKGNDNVSQLGKMTGGIRISKIRNKTK